MSCGYWASYTDYVTAYPDSKLSDSSYASLAERARSEILHATAWRAEAAESGTELAILRDCQMALINEVLSPAANVGTSGMVTSASNDGYSESYLSGAEQDKLLHQRQRSLISRYLSAPATGWMLYAGGVYHPPARR